MVTDLAQVNMRFKAGSLWPVLCSAAQADCPQPQGPDLDGGTDTNSTRTFSSTLGYQANLDSS